MPFIILCSRINIAGTVNGNYNIMINRTCCV